MDEQAYISSTPEEVSLEAKEEAKPKNYVVKKKDVSENIKAFDKKVKVFTKDPYDYNSISLKKEPVQRTLTAPEMIANPVYNHMAKFLGVDTKHDWESVYDKVYVITEWAKQESGIADPQELSEWVSKANRYVPTLLVGSTDAISIAKRVDEFYLYAKSKLKK